MDKRMDVKGDQEEYKHVCRLCNKRYPSGKSLGGHMRSHVIANSYVPVQKVKSKKAQIFGNKINGDHLHTNVGRRVETAFPLAGDSSASAGGDSGSLGGNNGYGLRENPKKTWRVVNTTVTVKQERVCNKCGKGFQSLKALCGHMSSHSDRERNLSRLDDDDDEDEYEDEDDDGDGEKEDDEDDDEYNLWASEEEDEEDKELAMESQSDNLVDAELSKHRSAKNARYRAIAVIDSFSLANGSSSNNSEIEQEQEEVALCLMMLSRDSGHRVGFNFTESSDNNSVILEGGSSSTYAAKRKHLNSASNNNNNNGNSSVKMKQVASKKLSCLEMDNSDSGYFENGAKELESDDSVDGYSTNYGIKKPKFEYRSGYDEEGSGAQLRKYSKNRVKNSSGFGGTELYDRAGSNKMKNDHLSSTQAPPKSSPKAGKYQCSICQRTFKTHQALGGHIITHRRDSKNAYSGLRHQETSNFPSKSSSKPESHCGKISIAKNVNLNADKKAVIGSKKTKGHCCPFCPKVFRSGQALGGHKRSHLIGCSSQEKANLIQSVEETPPGNHHPLLDLNLPAPLEEDGNDGQHAQFTW